ncbi:gamma-butyrobetaine hydroxylase-like domain-containing protein [Colwellia ponticola]|uniref:DUF971 domain-containing protein n=1 Tax=Colwellia ponticola TaxID=2304625 RepID=A0A8H2JNC5_9GAMM|nr:gamma-butyrobetaine hydroxylase-like domain-containing protein [Colwellia ponticola]TMM47677.1 DUF971 domain-containing protein [Colwellia ponticola]
MKINRFIIDNALHTLTIEFSADADITNAQLSVEYLRISSPVSSVKKPNTGQHIISHKKSVALLTIENVAKHGYRFIFDDGHSAIYSVQYLKTLVIEQESRWQQYLNELKTSGHSRDTMIDIKQL